MLGYFARFVVWGRSSVTNVVDEWISRMECIILRAFIIVSLAQTYYAILNSATITNIGPSMKKTVISKCLLLETIRSLPTLTCRLRTPCIWNVSLLPNLIVRCCPTFHETCHRHPTLEKSEPRSWQHDQLQTNIELILCVEVARETCCALPTRSCNYQWSPRSKQVCPYTSTLRHSYGVSVILASLKTSVPETKISVIWRSPRD